MTTVAEAHDTLVRFSRGVGVTFEEWQRNQRGGRMSRDNTVSVSMRLPKEMHEKMSKEADRRMVGVSYLYTKAIERLLDTLPPLDDAKEETHEDPRSVAAGQ